MNDVITTTEDQAVDQAAFIAAVGVVTESAADNNGDHDKAAFVAGSLFGVNHVLEVIDTVGLQLVSPAGVINESVKLSKAFADAINS
jgi:hypothetical protein